MATYDLPGVTAGDASLGGRLTSLIHRIAAWNEARQTREALNALSDRELDDVGLTRADIERIANL